MPAPERPLPESLTRLLTAPVPRAFAPTPGDRRRGDPVARPESAGDQPLEIAVLRIVVFGFSGLVWLGILWQSLRWMAR